MLTHLHIKNFKAWKDTGAIRLAPLTVIFGANSAGKSSLGQLLLALQQTARSTDRRRALHLGDASSLVDLGSFIDCLHGRDARKALSFGLGWALSETMEVRDPLRPDARYVGDHMRLDATLAAGKAQLPEVRALRYALSAGDNDVLDAALTHDARRGYTLKSRHYDFQPSDSRHRSLEAPEKFYRLPDASLALYRNAGFLADFALATESMLESIAYLGPLRQPPQRMTTWSGEAPTGVGARGEHTVAAILAAQAEGRQLSLGPRQRPQPFAGFIAAWLKALGVIHAFSVRPLARGRKEYEVLVKTHARAPEVSITDVGFGVSQVLPALVQAFYCPPHATVWMEQPEVHLHPQVQSELADVFIAAVQARENGQPRDVQLVIESHSEHFLNRLQRRVAEGRIDASQVAIYFCRRTGAATELEPLRLNAFGEIENWPEHFFGDEMADIAGRALAAMQRRKAAAKSPEP